jgi:hypothetical protein
MKSVQAPDLRLAIARVLGALTFSLSCFFGTRFATGPSGLVPVSAASLSGVSFDTCIMAVRSVLVDS